MNDEYCREHGGWGSTSKPCKVCGHTRRDVLPEMPKGLTFDQALEWGAKEINKHMKNIHNIAERLQKAYWRSESWIGVAEEAVQCRRDQEMEKFEAPCRPAPAWTGTFEEAISAVKRGEAVRREGWPAETSVVVGMGASPQEQPHCHMITGCVPRSAFLELHTADGYGPWVPQSYDIFADDWSIVWH